MNRILCGLWILSCTAVATADTIIAYDGTNAAENRWGAVYGITGDPNANLVETRAGWNGGWSNGHGFFQIGIFDITGLTVGNTPRVLLRVPETGAGGGAYDQHTLYAYHIVAASATTISAADATSADLGLVGITTDSFHPIAIGVYRPANSGLAANTARYTEFDVTDAVHADIIAGRTTFAFRIQHNQDEFYADYRRFFPSVSNPIKLTIKSVGTTEGPCNDGIDNDADGQTDCSDSDCQASPSCPETCTNGIDDNANGLTDCADPRCVGNAACPEVACADGLDNDADGKVDCVDPDCSSSAACPENCSNGVDDDANGLVDCADPDCSSTFSCGGYSCIKPTSGQDGHVIPGVEVGTAGGFDSTWGEYNALPWTAVGIHSLPAGISPSQIGTATLRIPQTDNAWTGDEDCLNLSMSVKHIDAGSDGSVTMPDGSSAPLATIGAYRSPGSYVGNNSRYRLFNVTAQVKADATAGRQSFAWRIEPDSIPEPTHVSARYFPGVDNTDGAFGAASPTPQYGPTDNHGAVLCILAPGLTEDSCTDGIDNDNNGKTDCADAACTNDAACPEICNNNIDDDGNGIVDCADPDCLGNPACPEKVCGDGIDNDNDGKTDCFDTDCFGSTACRSEKGYCGDGEDNDNDCLVDASDPDCVGSRVVKPTAAQDAAVLTAINSVEQGQFLFYGIYQGQGIDPVGIHTLPVGVSAANVNKARLQIPKTDLSFSADTSVTTLNLVTQHIAAASNTAVSVADGTSAPLDTIGVFRAPGPQQTNKNAFVEFDVTTIVKGDITAGRQTFAWRVEPDTTGAPDLYTYFYSPQSENSDNYFPLFNRGARLIISVAGEYEANCTDGVDNDGDGKSDCNDADCYIEPVCSANEICGDGVDNNGNGLADCQDTACVGSLCCTPPQEICTNGVDDTNDGLVDCADPQCTCAPNCGGPQPENCTDALDNDCNGDTDCADAACAINPVCLSCNNPFADVDGDEDVDMDDFGVFQRCYTGPEVSTPGGCGCFDRDADGHISQPDYEAFKLCASGSGVHADPNCDGAP